jgi:hypothetical protein
MSSSDWIIIPTIGENKKCSKPPIRLYSKTYRNYMEDVRFNASSFSSRHSEILEWKLGKKLEEMTLEHVTHPFQEHVIQRLAIRHEKITYPWIRLRGNQKETLVFPNKIWVSCMVFPYPSLSKNWEHKITNDDDPF